jgi:hypothetical protein
LPTHPACATEQEDASDASRCSSPLVHNAKHSHARAVNGSLRIFHAICRCGSTSSSRSPYSLRSPASASSSDPGRTRAPSMWISIFSQGSRTIHPRSAILTRAHPHPPLSPQANRQLLNRSPLPSHPLHLKLRWKQRRNRRQWNPNPPLFSNHHLLHHRHPLRHPARLRCPSQSHPSLRGDPRLRRPGIPARVRAHAVSPRALPEAKGASVADSPPVRTHLTIA